MNTCSRSADTSRSTLSVPACAHARSCGRGRVIARRSASTNLLPGWRSMLCSHPLATGQRRLHFGTAALSNKSYGHFRPRLDQAGLGTGPGTWLWKRSRDTTRDLVPPLAFSAFGWRRLHGRAGQRERARLRLREALRLLGRCLGLRLLFLREDVFLRATREQALELVLVDRLALDQDRRDLVQLGHVFLEHGDCQLVGLLDHALDLVVDLAGDLLGVVGLGAHLAAQERHVVVAAEDARDELVAHAVAHDHL